MKILLVEDETKAGEYLRKGLTEAGFLVDWVQDGANGLHLGCLLYTSDAADE